MDLEKRIEKLEKRVATLEGQVQEQPSIELIVQQISERLRTQHGKSLIPENPFGN